MKEAEETMRLREHLGRRRRWCVELITAALASEEDYGNEDSATSTYVSEGDKVVVITPRSTEASSDQDDNDRGVDGGSRRDDAPERTPRTAEAAVR